MNSIQLLVLLQTCLCWNLNEFQGPVSTPISSNCYDSSMTADGQYFYCSNFQFSLKIFKNNGHGLNLLQTFNLSGQGFFICNKDNGGYVRLGVGSSIYIYSLLSNGTYGESHIIDAGSSVNVLSCSDDLLIAPLNNGDVKIYKG